MQLAPPELRVGVRDQHPCATRSEHSLLVAFGKVVCSGAVQVCPLSAEVDRHTFVDQPLSRSRATRDLSGCGHQIGSSGLNPVARKTAYRSTTVTDAHSPMPFTPPTRTYTLNRLSRRVIIQPPPESCSGGKMLIAFSNTTARNVQLSAAGS